MMLVQQAESGLRRLPFSSNSPERQRLLRNTYPSSNLWRASPNPKPSNLPRARSKLMSFGLLEKKPSGAPWQNRSRVIEFGLPMSLFPSAGYQIASRRPEKTLRKVAYLQQF